MKITCPVPTNCNLIPFINKGITEFYFGYISPDWERDYSLINSINRRYSEVEQFYSINIVKKLFKDFKNGGVNFFMALNSPFYNTEQIKKILKMLRQFQKIGLNGAIVADIGLILAIKKNFPNLEIHISCVAPCLNSQSIKFYQTIGASRIILPRSLDIAEIESIRRENRKVKLEAIITTKDCLNIDGLCTHLHSNDNTTAPCTEETNYSKRIKTKVDRDSYLRLYYLNLIGIDYIKFPRRGQTAEEMLNKNNFTVSLINRLSRVKPKSISEIKEYCISK